MKIEISKSKVKEVEDRLKNLSQEEFVMYLQSSLSIKIFNISNPKIIKDNNKFYLIEEDDENKEKTIN